MNEDTLQLLTSNTWLNTLPKAVKTELISATKLKHFTANQRIHSKGDDADGLYCVLKGEIRISATTHLGSEFVFTRIQAGSWFGEIAILDNGSRTHDSFSVIDSELAIIPINIIQSLCESNIEVYQSLVSLLCSHCRLAFNAIDELLIYSNEQRLANIIVLRASENDHNRVNISQEDLGAQIGISRQSINKILKAWQTRGWIKRVYGGMEVLKMADLKGYVMK